MLFMMSNLFGNRFKSCVPRTLKLYYRCYKSCSLIAACHKPVALIFSPSKAFKFKKHTNRTQNFTSVIKTSGQKKNVLYDLTINDVVEDDIISTTIQSLDSCCDIMDYVNSLDSNDISSDHVYLALKCMTFAHYTDLYQRHEWLQSNIHIAFIQLSLTGNLNTYMNTILNHSGYEKLLKASHQHCDSMDVNKVAGTLLLLTYLGLSKYDRLCFDYLERIYNRVDDVPMQQWLFISQVTKSVYAYDYLLTNKICESMKTFINKKQECSLDDLYVFACLGINLQKMLKTETTVNFLIWFHKELSTKDLLEKPKYLSTYLRFLRKLSHNQFHLNDEITQSVRLIVNACKKIINTLESPDIADICRSLKVMRLYNDDEFIETIGKRINNLVDDSSRIADLSNFMYGLTKSAPNFLIRKFENYLFSKLSSENINIDIITLSNIADSLFELPKMNKDIVVLFQNLIVYHSSSIIEYITRFNKISKLLIKYPFIDHENEKVFTGKVIKYLDEKPNTSSYNVTYMGRYLLSLQSYENIPQHIFTSVMKSLPKWTIGELCKLYANINNSNLSTFKEQRQRYLQILGDVQQLLLEKLQDVDNITQIDSIALAMVVHTKFRNSFIIEHVENCFVKFGENLNANRVAKVAKLMRQTNFHIPEVFEKLVEFVLTSDEKGTDRCTTNVLRSLAFNGYRPLKMDLLFQPLKMIYEKEFFDKNLYKCLSLLNDLTILQFFPDDLLINFFKVNTIHDLEKFMEENEGLSMKVQTMLMQVNRCITIECPHLDIPWFHDHFCKENLDKDEFYNLNVKKLINEVNDILVQLLNGQAFVKKNCWSPFFHKFDFECALNKQKPVPVSTFTDKFDPSIQKFAICVLPETSFCKNSKVLNGKENVRKRHLQLLGYKYIEVPFFEWYSMGLTEKLTKKKYLKNKIFNI